jgi:hypothetical protein
MTGDTVRQLSDQQLLVLFADRRATVLPEGEFLGLACGWNVNPVWRGKRFFGEHGDRVINRIGRWELIEGTVSLVFGRVVIDYGYGITDHLRPITPTLWLGQLWFGSYRSIWFTLEAQDA